MLKCKLCGHEQPFKFLDLGRQPLANKYPTAEQFAAEDFFPLEVFFCESCKAVQLDTEVSRVRMFEDYYYLSSVNAGLVRHFNALAAKLVHARFVIDIGSNDGILLKPLKALGVKALGIEPSVNVSKIANDQGLDTVCAFFDRQTAAEVARGHGKADVIVASSVFTHLDNPHSFIDAVLELLARDGRFVIEVEYIGNILRTVQFERFYLDRIFYYSLTSLQRLAEAHGTTIVDVEHIEPHGGSLRVTIMRKDGSISQTDRVTTLLDDEMRKLTRESLAAFGNDVEAQTAALRDLLAKHKRNHVKVAGYGAPARVSTICNYGKIGPELLAFTVDDSPLKQNRFTPGTHIPIVSREHLKAHRPDVLVVFAYEYLDDIRNKTENAYRYLLPIPPRDAT